MRKEQGAAAAVIYVDASVDTEAGLAGVAVLGLLQRKGGGRVIATAAFPAGDANQAEAMAVELGLRLARQVLGPGAKVTLVCDNRSVVEHLQKGTRNGRSEVSVALDGARSAAKGLKVSFRHRERRSTPEMVWVDEEARRVLNLAREAAARKASRPKARPVPKGFLPRLLGALRRLLRGLGD
ncbi:ribonuclease H family protein [Thermus sp. LT1-2-5]|uniref:ribonuclease H family protein n=1 Tax=Thermus sp. LT1-2-5 TaxID=3026935 RepID=UPI0033659AEB